MIDVSDKKVIKELFSEWLDIQDQRKELTAVNKEVMDKVASILEVPNTIVTKLFNFHRKRVENGEDELDTLVTLSLEIQD